MYFIVSLPIQKKKKKTAEISKLIVLVSIENLLIHGHGIWVYASII